MPNRILSKKLLWRGLRGFYRGPKQYDYINKKSQNPAPRLYSDAFLGGLLGALYYANPFILPFTFSKELYRLEVNIRGARFKEELIQKTINPARFEKYIAQGYDVEDIFEFI